MRLTVLICTHNRAELLRRTLASLNAADRPAECSVDVLVVANACSDGTQTLLESYSGASSSSFLPLRWVKEPTPGKSHALNRGIGLLGQTDLVALVDDDHRIPPDYLLNICRAARERRGTTMFCGRILPDWNGREPAWVHDSGPYRIYPLPVPRYDQSDTPREITLDGPLPGGGNLIVRREVFERVGGFSTELGPKGHDLGGGEDSDFVLRALTAGERLHYAPGIVQYHYVDLERFRLRYIVQKGYQRSRSAARVHHSGAPVPRYMWRKMAGYIAAGLLSLSWPRARFYLVRFASALGELRGMRDSARASQAAPGAAPALGAMGLATAAALAALPSETLAIGAQSAAGAAALVTLLLVLKSLTDFSRTGPQIRQEIQKHYRWYSALALARLAFWSFALSAGMAAAGIAVYGCLGRISGLEFSSSGALAAALAGIAVATALQFLRHLLYLPATIAASSHYRLSRLYPLWRRLSPKRLRRFQQLLVTLGIVAALATVTDLLEQARWVDLALFAVLGTAVLVAIRILSPQDSMPVRSAARASEYPNIIMLGSDTLRADRLGAAGYRRHLTPNLDALARQGAQFTHCYVPCARTAPSLVSLFTGAWPHTHGIRDNFVAGDEVTLPVPSLAALLSQAGYRTAAVGDWSAADLGKFDLGFQHLDLPEDQWNIKYLIRQGPKDIRLFLSLFTHNRFGKRFLPELYYLAGIPLTREIGRDARAMISELAADTRPFFLNVFMATTHPPFGSEYPYYTQFSSGNYAGESKFVMARLTDPFEIIKRQGDSKKEFDLDHIIDLYDGCVKSFDDEVGRILHHLEACGLAQNTVIVVYSDHGMEFFEHDTWGQGNSVRSDFSTRIPLIVSDPRNAAASYRIDQIVRSIDIAPTLLDLIGLSIPPAMEGRSLRPCLLDPDVKLDLTAFAETGIWLTNLPGMPADHLQYPQLPDLLYVPNKRCGTLAIKPEYHEVIIRAKDRMLRSGDTKLVYTPHMDGSELEYVRLGPALPGAAANDAGLHRESLRQNLFDWIDSAGPVTLPLRSSRDGEEMYSAAERPNEAPVYGI